MDEQRAEFEAWAKQPPMEWDCDRYTENEAWPNDYRHYPAQCAWEGWQAATQLQQERIAELEAQVQALSLDAERLDYLQRHARSDPKMDGNHVWWPTSFNQAQNLKGPTLREAIDAAIAAGKGEG